MLPSLSDAACNIYYRWAYQYPLQFILVAAAVITFFIIAYLYFSTNWRPFKIIGKDDCPECGNPLHYGSSKCKWCGAILVDQISKSSEYTTPLKKKKPRPRPAKTPKTEQKSLIPYIIILSISVVLVLIFVFKVDTSYLICGGLAISLPVIYLLTQGPAVGRRHHEGNNLAKQADGRAYDGKK